jgi:glycerophosphoryl diester phosphodiesterase
MVKKLNGDIFSRFTRGVFASLLSFMFSGVLIAQVDYIAHRGASYIAPENTVISAKLAWEIDVDAVELDIQLSKDNKLMVIHDGNTKRTSGYDFVVKETGSKILRKLDVGSFKDEKYKGEKIPFLNEIIETVPPGKKLVVELKSGGDVLPELKNVVRNCGKQPQLIFICFDLQIILNAKQIFPEIPCYWLCGNKEELVKNIKTISDSGLQGVDLNFSIIDEKVISLAKSLNLDIIAYTVNDPTIAKKLIDYGVKGITTDRPDWLKNQINNYYELNTYKLNR